MSESSSSHGIATILLAEDEPFLRHLIKDFLVGEGYSVFDAPNGAEALRLLGKAERFDLLLTDVIMPELNGLELGMRIRALSPETQIIYISGYHEKSGFTLQELQEGINFIKKPFTLTEMAQLIHDRLQDQRALPVLVAQDRD